MAKLLTTLPDILFPQEADVLTFEATADFRVTVLLNAATILDVTLTPSASGTATLSDLASLISDAIDGTLDVFTLTVNADGTQAAQAALYPCRADIGVTAAAFEYDGFLTLATGGEKTIPADACESLTWAATDTDMTLSVTARWTDKATHRTVATTQQTVTPDDHGDFYTADVSPSRLTPPSDEWEPVRYDVRCGRRTMAYVVRTAGASLCPVTSVRFLNAFGAEDTFHFFGSVTEEAKHTYTAGAVGGLTRNYRIESQPAWKAETGVMNASTARLFRDLCASLRVWRADDGTELCLTDAELKPSNAWNALMQGTLTWRTAAHGERFALTPGARTFNKTFDKTFL